MPGAGTIWEMPGGSIAVVLEDQAHRATPGYTDLVRVIFARGRRDEGTAAGEVSLIAEGDFARYLVRVPDSRPPRRRR